MNPIIKGYLLKFIDEHQEYRDMQEVSSLNIL